MSEPRDLVPFVATSVEDAVAQVRNRLGPGAVVVQVRRIPVRRTGWFRRARQRLEILAYRPETSAIVDATSDAPAEPRGPPLAPSGDPGDEVPAADPGAGVVAWDQRPEPRAGGGAWRAGAILEASGFLPAVAQRITDQLRRRHGETPPEPLARELELVRTELARLWKPLPPMSEPAARVHIFVGGQGVGKTTCLCKWLTQAVLVQGRRARVWRLDGQTANTAETLSVHCEILGIPLERSRSGASDSDPDELQFVDLPGVPWWDRAAVQGLSRLLERHQPASVHLVVNAAYDVSLLHQQIRALSVLGPADLIVTHLDEESRWGRLWNLVLGTNYSIRYLSAGQNIPGDFFPATPERLFARQFPA